MAITDNTSWTSTIYGVLIHPDEPLIWLLSCDKGWTLPTAIVDKPVWIRPTHKIGETMGNSIGIPVIFMQCVSFERNRDEHQEESVFVLHSRRGGLPCFYTAGQWVSRTDLSSSDYVNVPHRKLLQDILREVEKALVPRERPSWARSDWFDEVTNWISLQLSKKGFQLTGETEQFSSWCLSSILRCQTDKGMVYFKASPLSMHFANEPLVAKHLASRFPGKIPNPICIDADRRWMLIDDFGTPIGDDVPINIQKEVLRQFCEIQVKLVPHVSQLKTNGCIYRGLETIPDELDLLLNDPEAMAGLTLTEQAQLQKIKPALAMRTMEVSTHAVPQTLVHGDLHMDNVTAPSGRIVFFDWTGASISHPFFDLIWIYLNNKSDWPHLRDTYLEGWTEFDSIEQLRVTCAFTIPLALLYQAFNYRYIIRGLEEASRSGFHQPVAYFIRLFNKEWGSIVQ